MSGRAAGFCAGYAMPGYANPAPGRGQGLGWGRGPGGQVGQGGGGRGRRNMFRATGQPGWVRNAGGPAADRQPDREGEIQSLRNQVEALQSQLDAIGNRLGGMTQEDAAQ